MRNDEESFNIHILVVFIFWVKTDEVQITVSASKCSFHPTDENG